MHAQLLKMLEGCSSQKPMPFDQLASKSGLLDSTLDMVLDQMYAAHTINQAKVMRNGVTQREVWPTGVISPTTYAIANAARVAPTPPLRRAEAAQKLTDETHMNTELKILSSAELKSITPKASPVTEAASPTVNGLAVLSYVIMKNQVQKQVLYDYFKHNRKKAAQTVDNLIRGGHLVLEDTTLRVGPNANHYLARHQKTDKPAPKVIATRPQDKAMLATEAGKELIEKATEALLTNPYTGKPRDLRDIASDPKGALIWDGKTPLKAAAEPAKVEYEIPAFLRKKAEPQEGEFGEFKVAYTSSGTLMLFGLQYLPVELSVEQTDLLIEYLDGQVK